MAVSATTDKRSTPTATAELADMRHGQATIAGSYCYAGKRLATGWHFHDLHQVEYAVSGLVEVEDISCHYLLPPQQAAWIPAGVAHQSTLHTTVRTISVFFERKLLGDPGGRVRILAVAPLIRELIIGSLRWPIEAAQSEPIAHNYFATLAHLIGETLEHEAPLRLPTCSDPLVAAAMAYTQQNLQSVSIDQVARAVGASARTVRRRFETHADLSWRSYLVQARILKAMALLAQPEHSVLDIALDVGFNSLTAFGRAFSTRLGETPSAYRRRLTTPPDPFPDPESHGRHSGIRR
jgi:AraC-like DNA-binding protein/quercetin dioxygenase-like cupin family protein